MCCLNYDPERTPRGAMTISTEVSRTAEVGHRHGRIVLQHQPAECPTALGQAVQGLKVFSRTGVWLWAGVLPQAAAWEGKVVPLMLAPTLPTLPPLSSWLPSWGVLSAVTCQAKIFV